jgi:cellulose synthase/poly-beta-1,6-N-acetylglucosamine synthase-like glycosyltransferase
MTAHTKDHTRKPIGVAPLIRQAVRSLWPLGAWSTCPSVLLLLPSTHEGALLDQLQAAAQVIVAYMTEYSLAALSLFFGLLFLAYAIKHYTSIALILFGDRANNGMDDNHGGEAFSAHGDSEPFVSIHLPLYNEEHVVDRLLTACTSFDYENYEVVVADDSTDATVEVLERWADHPRVKISHRPDRSGFKGAALQHALKRVDPRTEYIMIFDADFVPPPEIIRQCLAYFRLNGHQTNNEAGDRYGSRVGVVQGYQRHSLNASENWITKGVQAEFSASYMVDRPGRELYGGMKMISGAVYMIRADIIRELGWGTSITEDWEMTLRLYLAGYKVLYTPYIQAPAECVADIRQLVRQRMRWAEGHTYNAKRYFWRVLSSPRISIREKLDFFFFTPYYLQAFFFMIGTACWILGELLHQRLPFWPPALGWSLVAVNTLATMLVALSGLYVEGGARKSARGLACLWALSFILSPFYGYAALKGLLEKKEGGWHRTAKSGRITEILGGFKLRKKLRKLLPKSRTPQRATASHLPARVPPDTVEVGPASLQDSRMGSPVQAWRSLAGVWQRYLSQGRQHRSDHSKASGSHDNLVGIAYALDEDSGASICCADSPYWPRRPVLQPLPHPKLELLLPLWERLRWFITRTTASGGTQDGHPVADYQVSSEFLTSQVRRATATAVMAMVGTCGVIALIF